MMLDMIKFGKRNKKADIGWGYIIGLIIGLIALAIAIGIAILLRAKGISLLEYIKEVLK